MRVWVVRNSQAQLTSGTVAQSPGLLISGTAVPCLITHLNTALPLDGIEITLAPAFAVRATKPSSKRTKRVSERRANFDMMPASACRRYMDSAKDILLRTVNTPLGRKAEEEMSEFEREYPW